MIDGATTSLCKSLVREVVVGDNGFFPCLGRRYVG